MQLVLRPSKGNGSLLKALIKVSGIMNTTPQDFEQWARNAAERLEIKPSAAANDKFRQALEPPTENRRPRLIPRSIRTWAIAASTIGLLGLTYFYSKSVRQPMYAPAALVLEAYSPGPSEAMPLLLEFQSQQKQLALCKERLGQKTQPKY